MLLEVGRLLPDSRRLLPRRLLVLRLSGSPAGGAVIPPSVEALEHVPHAPHNLVHEPTETERGRAPVGRSSVSLPSETRGVGRVFIVLPGGRDLVRVDGGVDLRVAEALVWPNVGAPAVPERPGEAIPESVGRGGHVVHHVGDESVDGGRGPLEGGSLGGHHGGQAGGHSQHRQDRHTHVKGS